MIDDDKVNCTLTKKLYAQIEENVVKMYEDLEICKHPIEPFTITAQLGYITVPYSKLNEEILLFLKEKEMDGFSCYNGEENRYYIYYDDEQILARQNFTIMHEIGHIRMNHKESSVLADKIADYFAAYSLVPSPIVYLYCCEDFIDVMYEFNVSEACAVRCFNRFTNWQHYGGKIKPYEKRLLKLFENE